MNCFRRFERVTVIGFFLVLVSTHLVLVFAAKSYAEDPRPAETPTKAVAAIAPVFKKITIRGVCVDDQDSPIAGARVRVFRYPSQLDAPLLVAELRSGNDGTFVAKDVETAIGQKGFFRRGDLCVAGTAEGHVSFIHQLNEATLQDASPPTDPFAPASKAGPETYVAELSLVLRSNPGTLSGTVTNESGEPVSGVKVFLPWPFQHPLPEFASAFTDKAGRYAIGGLRRWQAGVPIEGETSGKRESMAITSHNFWLEHPDYGRKMAQFTGVPQVVNITLHPPAIVEGAVVDAVVGRPAANVIVSAQGVARGGWYQTRADGSGRYRLLMTKDHYNIWAEADDRIPIAAKAIAAEPGKTITIADIPLVRGAIVTGRVLDAATNEPLVSAGDRALYVGHYGPARPRTGAAVTSAEVGADGTYRLHIAPGTNYVYLMSGEAQASRVVTVKDGQGLTLDLRTGEHTADTADAFAEDLALAAKLRRQADEGAQQEDRKTPDKNFQEVERRKNLP